MVWLGWVVFEQGFCFCCLWWLLGLGLAGEGVFDGFDGACFGDCARKGGAGWGLGCCPGGWLRGGEGWFLGEGALG